MVSILLALAVCMFGGIVALQTKSLRKLRENLDRLHCALNSVASAYVVDENGRPDMRWSSYPKLLRPQIEQIGLSEALELLQGDRAFTVTRINGRRRVRTASLKDIERQIADFNEKGRRS